MPELDVLPGGTREAVDWFNAALNRHDAAAVAALLTEDTVFENAGPAPDGLRVEGRGVDVLTVRDGRIAAKLAYVKG